MPDGSGSSQTIPITNARVSASTRTSVRAVGGAPSFGSACVKASVDGAESHADSVQPPVDGDARRQRRPPEATAGFLARRTATVASSPESCDQQDERSPHTLLRTAIPLVCCTVYPQILHPDGRRAVALRIAPPSAGTRTRNSRFRHDAGRI